MNKLFWFGLGVVAGVLQTTYKVMVIAANHPDDVKVKVDYLSTCAELKK